MEERQTSTGGENAYIKTLNKLVSLSQVRLDKLRTGDVLNFKEELYQLLGSGSGHVLARKGHFFRALTPKKMVDIQYSFRHYFESFARGNTRITWQFDKPKNLAVAVDSPDINQRFSYFVDARDPIHAAWLSLSFLLIRAGVTPGRFRTCPECGSLFLLLRKPDNRNFYCSQKCAARAAMRHFRAGKGESRRRIKPRRSGRKPGNEADKNRVQRPEQ